MNRKKIILLLVATAALLLCVLGVIGRRSHDEQTGETRPPQETELLTNEESGLRIRTGLTAESYRGNDAVEAWLEKELSSGFGARVLCTRRDEGEGTRFSFLVRVSGVPDGNTSGEVLYRQGRDGADGRYVLQVTLPEGSASGETLLLVTCLLPTDQKPELTLFSGTQQLSPILSWQDGVTVEPKE